MLAEAHVTTVPPVAGIPIVHELSDGIVLERRDQVSWQGTAATEPPLTIRHEVGDARCADWRAVLDVPPWCTFHLDARGEPASFFHALFGEPERLLSCEEPGRSYVVRYGTQPSEAVLSLQSELTAYSFALAARGTGLIAHACAFITRRGDGVLCPGVSGTGKTTLARLLAQHAPTTELLTDDRAIVTLDDDGLRVWGSPWPGAAGIAGGAQASLRHVVFIRHGSSMRMRRVTPGNAFRRVLNTLSMPLWEPARCGHALEIVDAIVTRTQLVEAEYPPTADVATWLERELDLVCG